MENLPIFRGNKPIAYEDLTKTFGNCGMIITIIVEKKPYYMICSNSIDAFVTIFNTEEFSIREVAYNGTLFRRALVIL